MSDLPHQGRRQTASAAKDDEHARGVTRRTVLTGAAAGAYFNSRETRRLGRTIRRDLQALEQAGFPLISESRGGEVRWRFIDGYQPESPVALTTDELMALYFSRRLLEPLSGTPMYAGIESALQKTPTTTVRLAAATRPSSSK